jgi:DNA repair photolyase
MPRPVANPPNPWLSTHVEYLDDIPDARLEVFEEDARTILAENDSPDIPFRWGVNPYRGCYHGCAYCYARPTHEYLGWGAGTDFERKIVVKRNAPELLRAAFDRRGWTGERVAFSGVTDCYQPLEAAYQLTRRSLEVCLDYRNPVHVITKSALVARDAELLARLSAEADAVVILSIPFADDESGRNIEPYASRISKRFAALARLTAAGVRTAVAVAPVIPGLNDSHIPAILTRARECGATRAFMTMVRLTRSVLPVFEQRLTEAVPLRAGAVLSAIRDVRGGQMNRGGFGERMRGEGPRWQAIEQLFAAHVRRLGYEPARPEPAPSPFRVPSAQRSLFADG